MPFYRIFTNDRGKKRGVPMYSAFKPVKASNAAAAVKTIDKAFGPPRFSEIVAIQWPPYTPSEIAWLKEHVG